MTLSPVIGWTAIRWMRVPDGRLAPIRTPIGSPPEKATMQLLHQICRSRIDRLNEATVVGGSSGWCGAQQRFSASTSSPMSSVRQNLYELDAATTYLINGQTARSMRYGFPIGSRTAWT